MRLRRDNTGCSLRECSSSPLRAGIAPAPRINFHWRRLHKLWRSFLLVRNPERPAQRRSRSEGSAKLWQRPPFQDKSLTDVASRINEKTSLVGKPETPNQVSVLF